MMSWAQTILGGGRLEEGPPKKKIRWRLKEGRKERKTER